MPRLTEADRRKIADYALTWNGWGDGTGYPGKNPNPACTYVGHGLEYSCADGVTMIHGHCGFPLISMQPGMAEGYAYCPDALAAAKKIKGAVIPSWSARAGDILLIDTGDGAQPGHTETVTGRDGDRVFSLGFDSGPSNVDHYTGQGGCHRHVWTCPPRKGNSSIIAVLDADKVIDWSKVGQAQHTGRAAKKKQLAPAPLSKTAENKVTAATRVVTAHKAPVKAGKCRAALRRLRAAITTDLKRK